MFSNVREAISWILDLLPRNVGESRLLKLVSVKRKIMKETKQVKQ